MGPSASEVHDAYGDDQVAALVKSLSHIQHTLQDPKLRAVISNVAPNLLTAFGPDGGVEYQDAFSGKPSSSRPAGTESKQAVIEKPAYTPIPKVDEPTPTPKDVPVPGEEDLVNSSTHRAAHARLSRRMSAADAAKFPHMCKLWQGSRKEGS